MASDWNFQPYIEWIEEEGGFGHVTDIEGNEWELSYEEGKYFPFGVSWTPWRRVNDGWIKPGAKPEIVRDTA